MHSTQTPRSFRRPRPVEILTVLLALYAPAPGFGGGIQFIPADLEHSGTTEGDRIGRSVAATGEQVLAGGSSRQEYLVWDAAADDWELTGSFTGSDLVTTALRDGRLATVRGPLGATFVHLLTWDTTSTPTEILPIPTSGDVEAVAVDRKVLALGRPTAFSDSGRVTIWINNHGAWESSDTFQMTDSQRFGAAVAIDSDDTSTTLAIGIPGGPGDTGQVQVWRRAGSWSLEATLAAPGLQADNDFGTAVAVDDGWLAVGAPRHDTAFPDPLGTDSGAVYLYRRDSSGDWAFSAAFVGSDGDHLGHAVDMGITTLAVGAPLADAGPHPVILNAGSVRLYRRFGELWGALAVLQAPTPGAFDHLGTSVAISGRGILAGAPERDDPLGDNVGTIYTWLNTVPLFVDGFESGSTQNWSGVSP